MYNIFNEILGLFDPFTNDIVGDCVAKTSSTVKTSSVGIDPSTGIPKLQYTPYAQEDIWKLPSNMNAKIYIHNNVGLPGIKDVIFNPPATIVLWEDGTKTVVKCQHSDVYSKETGLALAICKKAYGNKGSYNDIFNKWVK